MPRTRVALLPTTLLSTVALLAGFLGAVSGPPTPAQAAAPRLSVTRVVGGLKVPWDLTWVGRTMLFDQRAGGVWSKQGSAAPRRVRMALPPVYARGESGMLGLVADPQASRNGYFYTCIAVATPSGGAKGVEVWKWKLTTATTASYVRKLVIGIPLASRPSAGRHSGCRLRFRSTSMLYIGTGDAAVGTNPQNLSSLGGKVLRVRSDGSIPTTNPFYSRGGNARYVWSYGHRNVQGLAKRPGQSEIWSVEHGPTRDDEVNRIWRGRNYGWAPTPGYNESRPMTDKGRFPSANGPKWRSGSPTVAASGAAFFSGGRWKDWNGRLAVALLKGQGVRVFTLNSRSQITASQTVLQGYGRIRTVQLGPDGNLYFATSNGSGDGIYRVVPR